MDYADLITRYYRAFRERDRPSLDALLAPDFHFISSFGEYRGRDAMLDEIWPSVGRSWAAGLRIFGEGPELMALYHHESVPGAEQPCMTMAECFRFEGDRIAEVEVYVGRRFEPAE